MKILGILLAASLILTGCAQGVENTSASDDDSPEQIEVDQGLLTVDITFPESFVNMGSEEFTQARVDETAASEGYLGGKLNSDGSVTYTMTKFKHNEIIEETKRGFDDYISESLADYPNVTAVTRNSDFTEIVIETTENDFMVGILGFGLSIQAYFFHVLNGSEYKVDVIVKDSDSGEELIRTTYPVEE